MMKTLTISRKIAFGFGALLLITCGLGGLSVTSMKSVQHDTRMLAIEYVPEIDILSDLQRHLAAAQLSIRSYGLTASENYLQETRKELLGLHEEIKRARELSERFANLGRLREQLGTIDRVMKGFEKSIDDTAARNVEVAGSRTKLDAAALEFVSSIDTLREAQTSKLRSEIKDGLAATALAERAEKLFLIEEIRNLGSAARISVFKAQALRDHALFQDGLKNFEAMEARFARLFALLKVKADIDELTEVKHSASAYRDAVQVVMNGQLALVEIGKARLAAAEQLLGVANETQATAMKSTIQAAQASDQHLATSASVMMIGVAVALCFGFATAFYISRDTTKTLTRVADDLSETSLQVTAAAGQVASASQVLAEGATEQAASLEETSASLEEISSMTKRNADGARQAKDLSNVTRASAETGATHMQEMQTAMNAIKTSSDDIAKIIKTIDEIAFQTNILALNAAVEAARAGEAGMGFAVVADEVRSLAQRSAQSAKETAAKIEDAIQKSEHGVAISGKVSKSLTEIVAKARQVDELVAEIATASSEQNQGIGQLNTAMSQMDKVTQSNASSAEESAAAAEELNAQAAAMQESVTALRRLVTQKTSDHAAPEIPSRVHTPAAQRTKDVTAARHDGFSPRRRQPALDFREPVTPGVDSNHSVSAN